MGPARKMIWGGLFAWCSHCAWKRIYEPGASVHRLPDAELTAIILAEFESHRCSSFPQRKA